jgi:hypothetical protein
VTKKILSITAALIFSCSVNAQTFEYVHQGDVGITAGAAHYFGDINTRAGFNRPKPALGLFYRKQFGNYVGVRLSGHYAQLGYSDRYSKNEYQRTRNLSFNTNVWEVAIHGDFNFFKFVPNDTRYYFTPYITIGVGGFTYDPYAYLNDKKEFLRPLGTEGQTVEYMGRKPYKTLAACIPFGAGIKYNITESVNVSFEVNHRFTFTDYLDDVSTTYIGDANFPATGTGPTAKLLSDRSYEILGVNNGIGTEGRQRGWSKQKDQYIIVELGVSFNISTYRCPSAN